MHFTDSEAKILPITDFGPEMLLTTDFMDTPLSLSFRSPAIFLKIQR